MIRTALLILALALTAAGQTPKPGVGGGGAGGGDTTAVANSGAGETILKAGSNVVAKSLVAGANITLTPGADSISIAATGGGAGVDSFPGLVTFLPVRTSATMLTIACSSAKPCMAKRTDGTVAGFTSDIVASSITGSGEVRFAWEPISGTVLFIRGTGVTSATCNANCIDTTGTAFPATSDSIYLWSTSSSVLDATGTDYRPMIGGRQYTAGTGLSLTSGAFSIGPTVTTFSSGTGAAPGTCVIGERYIKTNTAQEYTCTATNTYTETTGGGSSLPSGVSGAVLAYTGSAWVASTAPAAGNIMLWGGPGAAPSGDTGLAFDTTGKVVTVARSNAGGAGGKISIQNSGALTAGNTAVLEFCLTAANCNLQTRAVYGNIDGSGSQEYFQIYDSQNAFGAFTYTQANLRTYIGRAAATGGSAITTAGAAAIFRSSAAQAFTTVLGAGGTQDASPIGLIVDGSGSVLSTITSVGAWSGPIIAPNTGIEFTESDTNPTCAAGNFTIFADLSENKLKKCQNGSATDLDTTGGTASFDTLTGGTNAAAAMVVGTGASLTVSGSGTINATSLGGTAAASYALLASPSFTTPTLGVATVTSINKVAVTAPATSATLTIADGKTLTVSNTLTFTGTDSSSIAFGAGGTVVYTATGVTAASTFATDNSCLRADSTSRGAQATAALCTIDDAGVITAAGIITAGTIPYFELPQGTASTASANSFRIIPPTSITTAYTWTAPTGVGASGVVLGTVSGANVALSVGAITAGSLPATLTSGTAITNAALTTPAVTTNIQPASAGGAAIGTNALPFSSVFIGASGSTIELTGTSTSDKVSTFPDVTGTVAVASTSTTTTQALFATATAGAPAYRQPAFTDVTGIATPAQISQTVNAQVGTTYTVLNSDRAKLVTISNASAIAVTLPQAGASSEFISGWFAAFETRGAGTMTITPTTSTIDGAATLVLTQNQGVSIFSDGTNYFTGNRGIGGAGTGCVPTGSSTQVLTDSGISTCTSNAAFTYAAGTATLGTAGSVVGAVVFKNATSGTITLQPATGALGTVTLTMPATTGTIPSIAGTLAVASGKTLTASNTLTFVGTDSTTMTFPSTSATIARTDAANSFTGVQTMTSAALTTPVVTTDIHAVSAGGATLGSAALPFSSVYIGGAATNNIRLTGTSAAARVMTIPDAGADKNMSYTFASGTAALDFASSATGTCATVIQTAVTSLLTTDVILFTPNASIKAVTGYVPASTGGMSITAYPTAGQINWEGCNWTAGTVDAGSITVNYLVLR